MQQSKQSHRVHLAAGSEPPPAPPSQTTVSSTELVQLTAASIPP